MASILEEVQAHCAERLNADPELSGRCSFVSENRRDLEYEIKNRLGRQGLVGVVMTPKAVYAGKYEDLFLAWQLDELEVDVIENVPVNRGRKDGFVTGQEAAMRAFQVLCPLSGEYEGQFQPVSYEEGEDGGLVVNKCVFKALVCGEREPAPPPEKPVGMKFMKLLDEPPAGVQPRDGWAWLSGDQFFCCAGERVVPLGVAPSWMSSYVQQGLSAKADLSALNAVENALSDYYTKGETSSAAEIGAALGLKQDKLTDEQMANASTKCLPLNLSGSTAISGNNYLDFHCLPRFFAPVVMNGALDVKQLNVVNYEVDSYMSLSAIDEDTIGFVGGFNREHVAVLNLKNGEVAYVSDIEQAVSSRALKEEVPLSVSQLDNDANYIDRQALNQALSSKVSKSGDTVQWIGIGRAEQRLQSGGQLGFQFSIDDFGSAQVKPKGGLDVKLDFPGRDGTLATEEWTQGEISAKADVSALSGYLPLSGGSMEGPIQMGPDDGNRLRFANHSVAYASPDSIGFFTDDDKRGAYLDLYHTLPLSDGVDYIAYRRDIDQALSAKADLSALNLALDKMMTKAKYQDGTVSSFLFVGDTPEIFPDRENVVEVELGLGVSAIGTFTFNGATRLKSVKCNEGMVEIKGAAFSGCTSLSSINFPSTLTAIYGDGAIFGRCTSLYDVEFPEGLKAISQYCFLDAPVSSAVFRGKTMEQVSAMTWYPWAIQRDAIRTWNAASREWVLQQLSALQPGA